MNDEINKRFEAMKKAIPRMPSDLHDMTTPEFKQKLIEYLKDPPPPRNKNNYWANNIHKILKQVQAKENGSE